MGPRAALGSLSPYRAPASLLGCLLLLAASSPAFSASELKGPSIITVDGVTCTLSDAIRAANDGATVGGCTGIAGLDQITLEVDVVLSSADTVHSSLVGGAHAGLPDVTSPIVITAGAGTTVQRDSGLSCNAADSASFRLFNVASTGELSLDGLTLRGGCVAPPLGVEAEGGAIHVDGGQLEIVDGVLEGNRSIGTTALTSAGALYCGTGSQIASITSTTFRDNIARGFDSGSGSAIAVGGAGTFDGCALDLVRDTVFESNQAIGSVDGGAAGSGGALYLEDTDLELLETSTFDSNRAQGGVSDNGMSRGRGGGIFLSTGGSITSISATTFRENRASGGGSGFFSGEPGQGGGLFLDSASGGIGEIGRSLFLDNIASGGSAGAGESPGPGRGGAIAAEAPITRIADSYFRGNRSRAGTNSGFGGASSAFGGALHLSAGGDISMLERSTFASNVAQSEVAFLIRTRGGAISMDGAEIGKMVDCTFVGNRAVSGIDDDRTKPDAEAMGGAIYIDGSLDFAANSFVANGAQAGSAPGAAHGGAIWVAEDKSSSFEVRATGNLFDDNLALQADGTATPEDCFEEAPEVVSDGFNLVESPGNCTFAAVGDQISVASSTYPLDDWGCATTLPDGTCVPTAAIDQSSPAADAGSCNAAGIAVDARQVARPFDLPAVANVDDGCDVGAFEAVDSDGDGVTEAADCAPDDPGASTVDNCGLCGGDDSTCSLFADGFESGDPEGWSSATP